MTHPSATVGLSHLLSAALTEVALHLASLQYLGKARVEPASLIFCAAHSDAPTSGTCLPLDVVFSLCQGMLGKIDMRRIAFQLDMRSLQAAGF